MSIPKGEIQFKPQAVLQVGEQYIETANVSSSELKEFVIYSVNSIGTYVEKIYKRDIEKARQPENVERPIIHVARLALLEYAQTIFETPYAQELKRVTTTPQILLPAAQDYWSALAETAFVPEVHIRGIMSTEGTRGIWLSLRTPDKG
jgi:N-glycosylase/DNA lyase